jgi:hypothetical protein
MGSFEGLSKYRRCPRSTTKYRSFHDLRLKMRFLPEALPPPSFERYPHFTGDSERDMRRRCRRRWVVFACSLGGNTAP